VERGDVEDDTVIEVGSRCRFAARRSLSSKSRSSEIRSSLPLDLLVELLGPFARAARGLFLPPHFVEALSSRWTLGST